MKIHEILTEDQLDEGMKHKVAAAAMAALGGLAGMSHSSDADAQYQYAQPPENRAAAQMGSAMAGNPPPGMILNNIPQGFVPGMDPRSIPPQGAISYMPPTIPGWSIPFWWINGWYYTSVNRNPFANNWQPNYWRQGGQNYNRGNQPNYRQDYRPNRGNGYNNGYSRQPKSYGKPPGGSGGNEGGG
jgi:hypothetical protein